MGPAEGQSRADGKTMIEKEMGRMNVAVAKIGKKLSQEVKSIQKDNFMSRYKNWKQ